MIMSHMTGTNNNIMAGDNDDMGTFHPIFPTGTSSTSSSRRPPTSFRRGLQEVDDECGDDRPMSMSSSSSSKRPSYARSSVSSSTSSASSLSSSPSASPRFPFSLSNRTSNSSSSSSQSEQSSAPTYASFMNDNNHNNNYCGPEFTKHRSSAESVASSCSSTSATTRSTATMSTATPVSTSTSSSFPFSTINTTTTSSSQSAYKSTPLPPNFQPGPYDVICARGKQAWHSSGNQYFRSLVDAMVDQYASTKNKAQRSIIVSNIVDTIRQKASGGFVKQEPDGSWVEVGDTLAREKVGQLFRNALSSSYKSSNSSKKRRRDEAAHKFQESLHKVMIQNEAVANTTQTMANYAAQPKIADEDVIQLFSKRNSALLEGVIKPDKELVDEFTKTFSAGMSKITSSTTDNNNTAAAADDDEGDDQMDDL